MITFNTKAYMKNLEEATDREFDYRKGLGSGDWQEWQTSFRDRLIELTGLQLIRKTTGANIDLQPEVTETKDFDTYTREKIYIYTEPGIKIPFYFLLPKGSGPFPLVITPHGHGKRGKEIYVGNNEGLHDELVKLASGRERDIALQAVAEGYAVIAPDQRGFWEMSRMEELAVPTKNDSCLDLQRKAMLYGRTLIGERVHDMGRLIDYAFTRPEVDQQNVIITGCSGGGTTALFTAALDERITVAMPGAYFCSFTQSILPIDHCMCNVVPGIMQVGELYDIVGLIAPRPLLLINGREDPIFPIEGAKEGFSHVKKMYEALGYPEQCELYIGEGGHRYYKERAWSFTKAYLRKEE